MNTHKYLFFLMTVLFLMAGNTTLSADERGEYKEFKSLNYPSTNFNIIKTQFHHGEVVISIIQVKNKRDLAIHTNDENDFYCRAWFSIEKNGKILSRQYFNIEPVGGSYGIYVPKNQPSPDYFIFEKDGDYKTTIYLIEKDGKVNSIHGGNFFVTNDSKYLFSQNYESEDGVTDVFDLIQGKLIFSGMIPNYEAYRKNGLYFYSKLELAPNGNDEVENKKSIYYFDFKNSKFIIKNVNEAYFKGATKVKDALDANDFSDCNCGTKEKDK